MNVVWDSMGTLFERTPLEEALGKEALEAWFERTIHTAACLTIVDEFIPFADLARATLATTAAMLDLEVDPDEIAERLQALPPAHDARAALERVRELGGRSFILTNGGRDAGEHLVEAAGFGALVERVFGVDEVKAYKPDPRPYRHVLDTVGDATLVATHAWDVVGAARAGMHAVWVDRSERLWPFPQEVAPHATVRVLVQAAGAAASATRR